MFTVDVNTTQQQQQQKTSVRNGVLYHMQFKGHIIYGCIIKKHILWAKLFIILSLKFQLINSIHKIIYYIRLMDYAYEERKFIQLLISVNVWSQNINFEKTVVCNKRS